MFSVTTKPYADHVSLATMATKCAAHYTYKPSTLLKVDFSPLQRCLYTSPISSLTTLTKTKGRLQFRRFSLCSYHLLGLEFFSLAFKYSASFLRIFLSLAFKYSLSLYFRFFSLSFQIFCLLSSGFPFLSFQIFCLLSSGFSFP